MARNSKKSSSGARGKTGSTTRVQQVMGTCPKCGPDVEVQHVLTICTKKRWSWNCKSCGAVSAR